MNLGQNILNKISDLLVEIQRPKSPKRRRKMQRDNANKFDGLGDRLYNDHKKVVDKTYEREKQKIQNQIANMQNFKVQNKHTIFLNSRKNTKPIHQRAQDIIRERQISVEKKRAQVQRERKRKKMENGDCYLDDDEDCIPLSNSNRKVGTKQQLSQVIERLTNNDRERRRRHNEEKMRNLKAKIMNNTGKPKISKQSQRIWEKKQCENSLSPNVFERFDKYIWDYKKKNEEFRQQYIEKQTPFRPKLSKNTLMYAQIARSKSPNDQISKSTSCKCLSKQQRGKSNSTFSDIKMQKSNNSKSPLSIHEQSMDRLRKSKTHLTIDPYC